MFSKFFKKTSDPVEYELMLKKGILKYIMKAKGWKNYQEVGAALGYTRQYISMLDNRKAPVTADFAVALAVAIGSLEDGWAAPFEIVKKAPTDPDSPVFNYDKFNRIRPYSPDSDNAEFRDGEKRT